MDLHFVERLHLYLTRDGTRLVIGPPSPPKQTNTWELRYHPTFRLSCNQPKQTALKL